MGSQSAALTRDPAKRAKQRPKATVPVFGPAPDLARQGLAAQHKITPLGGAGVLAAIREIPVCAPSECAAATPPAHALPGLAIQRKLAIGAVNDPLEAEADRVAEHVMRTPLPAPMSPSPSGEIAQRTCKACAQEQQSVRRKCEPYSEEDQRKKDEETHEKLSRKESGGAAALNGATAPPIVHEVLRSSGQPLDEHTRNFFEAGFGRSFADVRVHADSFAAESAAAVHARAYTVGADVGFAANQYSPQSPEGKKLLAHELAHVVQQTASEHTGGLAASPGRVQRQIGPGPDVKEDSPRFEGDKKIEDITAGLAKLKKGDTGLQVRKLQQALVDMGYLPATNVTGNFQDQTQHALIKFQADKGIAQSGELDAATMKALNTVYDTRKPYIDQAKNDPLHPGTRMLSAPEKTAAVNALVPAPVAGAPSTFQDDLGPPKGTYGPRIQARLTTIIASAHKKLFEDMEPLRADPAKNFHSWAVLEAPAKAAKDVVDNLYGSNYGGAGAKPALTHTGGNLIDQWADEIATNASLTAPQEKAKARGKVWYLINSNCEVINREHSAVPSAAVEKAILDPIVDTFVSDAAKIQTMLDLDIGWPGAQLDGKVYLQRYKSTESDATIAKEANRVRMWGLFQICIHEYIHTLADPSFKTWANSFRTAGDETRYNSLIEGFADFFTLNVRKTVVPSTIQATVEGPYANGKPPAPDTARVYPSNEQAEQVVSIVGIKNAQAAYFGGKTELLGKV